MPHPRSRFVIIGGGVIGTAVALALARRKEGPVTVLEKELSLGQHASGRNSGVIHSGINQKPGSLKARMCVEGSQRLRDYCRNRGIPMAECGTLVVAREKKEEAVLERLLELGRQCGVPRLSLITQKELKAKEPLVRGVSALFSPTGAVVDPVALLNAMAREAQDLGVEYRLGHRVLRIDGNGIRTPQGTLGADHIINCAGLYADEIAHQRGVGKRYRVIPFRGEYWEVKDCEVHSMVYAVPDLQFPFLGIHLTKRTDGRVLAGPSATLAFGLEAYQKEWKWGEMLRLFRSRQFLRLIINPTFLRLVFENAKISFFKQAFLKEVQSLIPDIQVNQLKPAPSGIRAQIVDSEGRLVDDILVEYRKDSTHILNAVSPGMTCSLVFGEHVVRKILD